MRKPLPQPVRVYRVGGSVRDELLGLPVADRDWVVVGATPEIMVASGYRPVGRDFPVFLHPETHEEYALARTERKSGAGYRGFAFFASPEVTLEDDLARRDLTINAMARADDGTLVDPYGGERDLREGVLRHVSPAFAEDPLRVLRVARFAARFGFRVAPATAKLMRAIAAAGELPTIAPERVWTELARGLMEAHPSRMLVVLERCGALDALLPGVGGGPGVARALDHGARRGFALPVRYAVLANGFGAPVPADARARVRRAERISRHLCVPADCRELARLAARWRDRVQGASGLTPAAWLRLFDAADALRRPERLDALVDACECDALARPGARGPYAPRRLVNEAFAATRGVDAGAIATALVGRASARGERAGGGAIAKAVRTARLAALAAWRRGKQAGTSTSARR
ncbi:MAG: multifunctional CCA tRNA nucleotidyl transferase/2'3'-cyclic phosphodiesterase/2'nucleotidase/phosphatase [Betaproteobacteria bacterium]|nr:multifunctional CCA tRNA nucleotidyl transferase/2'3'-cyclic phosphodiesterase/2'nucleotidase/phosphatase [Betaproteobacteria bacterium]